MKTRETKEVDCKIAVAISRGINGQELITCQVSHITEGGIEQFREQCSPDDYENKPCLGATGCPRKKTP